MKKVILINIIFIVSIFLLIEFSIRIFSNITVHGIADGIINQSTKPKFNYPNISGRKVFGKKVYTDEKGFRVVKKNQRKINDKLDKVYFIGGSVTFGSGVNQEETFSGIFGEKNKNINVYNASVIGSNLSNNLNILEEKVNPKNLNKVFINLSLDDIIDNQNLIDDGNLLTNNSTFIKILKENIIIQKANSFVRAKSVTWVWLKGAFLNSVERYYNYSLDSFRDKKNLLYLDKNLSLISNFNQTFNNKIVILIIPYSQQIKNENCNKEDLAEIEMKKSLKNNNLDFIAVKNIFCATKNKDKIFLKHDPSHLSPYGHKTLAKFLIKEFK